MSKEFKLWIEFEEVNISDWDPKNGFCNIHVYMEDGRKYGINVWAFEYFQTSIEEAKNKGHQLNVSYQIPPDLFVRELTRDCIEKTISDLLNMGDLEIVLNPSVYSKAT